MVYLCANEKKNLVIKRCFFWLNKAHNSAESQQGFRPQGDPLCSPVHKAQNSQPYMEDLEGHVFLYKALVRTHLQPVEQNLYFPLT